MTLVASPVSSLRILTPDCRLKCLTPSTRNHLSLAHLYCLTLPTPACHNNFPQDPLRRSTNSRDVILLPLRDSALPLRTRHSRMLRC